MTDKKNDIDHFEELYRSKARGFESSPKKGAFDKVVKRRSVITGGNRFFLLAALLVSVCVTIFFVKFDIDDDQQSAEVEEIVVDDVDSLDEVIDVGVTIKVDSFVQRRQEKRDVFEAVAKIDSVDSPKEDVVVQDSSAVAKVDSLAGREKEGKRVKRRKKRKSLGEYSEDLMDTVDVRPLFSK